MHKTYINQQHKNTIAWPINPKTPFLHLPCPESRGPVHQGRQTPAEGDQLQTAGGRSGGPVLLHGPRTVLYRQPSQGGYPESFLYSQLMDFNVSFICHQDAKQNPAVSAVTDCDFTDCWREEQQHLLRKIPTGQSEWALASQSVRTTHEESQ